MPWHASLHPELPIIETVYSGNLTPSELSDAIDENIRLVRLHGQTALLSDCTGLTHGHSLVDLYYAVDAVLASGMAPLLKEALLLPDLPAPADKVKFWETACLNRGLRVRIFVERQRALEWLIE